MLTEDDSAALEAVSYLASRPEELLRAALPSWGPVHVRAAMPSWEVLNDSQGTTASREARELEY